MTKTHSRTRYACDCGVRTPSERFTGRYNRWIHRNCFRVFRIPGSMKDLLAEFDDVPMSKSQSGPGSVSSRSDDEDVNDITSGLSNVNIGKQDASQEPGYTAVSGEKMSPSAILRRELFPNADDYRLVSRSYLPDRRARSKSDSEDEGRSEPTGSTSVQEKAPDSNSEVEKAETVSQKA